MKSYFPVLSHCSQTKQQQKENVKLKLYLIDFTVN